MFRLGSSTTADPEQNQPLIKLLGGYESALSCWQCSICHSGLNIVEEYGVVRALCSTCNAEYASIDTRDWEER
jgi:hypothetical protein